MRRTPVKIRDEPSSHQYRLVSTTPRSSHRSRFERTDLAPDPRVRLAADPMTSKSKRRTRRRDVLLPIADASVGANNSVSVGGDRSLSVTGNLSVTVSGGGNSANHSAHSVTGKYSPHASDTIAMDAFSRE
jgi:hypothetical protein